MRPIPFEEPMKIWLTAMRCSRNDSGVSTTNERMVHDDADVLTCAREKQASQNQKERENPRCRSRALGL